MTTKDPNDRFPSELSDPEDPPPQLQPGSSGRVNAHSPCPLCPLGVPSPSFFSGRWPCADISEKFSCWEGLVFSCSPVQMPLSEACHSILSSHRLVSSLPWSALKFSNSPQGPIKSAAKGEAELGLERRHTWQDLATGPESSNQGTGKEADPSRDAGVKGRV